MSTALVRQTLARLIPSHILNHRPAYIDLDAGAIHKKHGDYLGDLVRSALDDITMSDEAIEQKILEYIKEKTGAIDTRVEIDVHRSEDDEETDDGLVNRLHLIYEGVT